MDWEQACRAKSSHCPDLPCFQVLRSHCGNFINFVLIICTKWDWNTTVRTACLLLSAVRMFIFRDLQTAVPFLCVLYWRDHMATLKILCRSPLQENPIFSVFVWLFMLSVGLMMFLCSLQSCLEEPAVLGKWSKLPLWMNFAFCEETWILGTSYPWGNAYVCTLTVFWKQIEAEAQGFGESQVQEPCGFAVQYGCTALKLLMVEALTLQQPDRWTGRESGRVCQNFCLTSAELFVAAFLWSVLVSMNQRFLIQKRTHLKILACSACECF